MRERKTRETRRRNEREKEKKEEREEERKGKRPCGEIKRGEIKSMAKVF